MKNPHLMKHRKQFIASMEELKTRYEEAMKLGISKAQLEARKDQDCLLCNPLGVRLTQRNWYRRLDRLEYSGSHFKTACTKLGCPWIVITGMTCDESYKEADKVYACYHSNDPEEQQERIDQLDEWIELYKNFKKEK